VRGKTNRSPSPSQLSHEKGGEGDLAIGEAKKDGILWGKEEGKNPSPSPGHPALTFTDRGKEGGGPAREEAEEGGGGELTRGMIQISIDGENSGPYSGLGRRQRATHRLGDFSCAREGE